MKRLTTEEFVERAMKVHGSRYSYDSTVYKTANDKVEVHCKTDGHGMFYPLPGNHLKGSGCPLCAGNAKLTTGQFISKAMSIHGEKYGYGRAQYVSYFKKVLIECRVHGPFMQTPADHLSGKGCGKCIGRYKTTSQFIEELVLVHGARYDYSKMVYKGIDNKIEIVCKKHGSFWQKAGSHRKGFGCIYCRNSRGEDAVEKSLERLLVAFEKEKKFGDCYFHKNYPLRFDFYLPEFNAIIEFDGMQHYVESWQKSLKRTQRNDDVKNRYCVTHGIPILRIPYSKLEETQSIVEKYVNWLRMLVT